MSRLSISIFITLLIACLGTPAAAQPARAHRTPAGKVQIKVKAQAKDRRDARKDRRDDRKDARKDRRDDRKDARKDRRDVRKDRREDRKDRLEDRRDARRDRRAAYRHSAYQRELARRRALARRHRDGQLSVTEKDEWARLQVSRGHYTVLFSLERERRASWERRRREARERERARYLRLRSDPLVVAEYRKHAYRVARLRRVRDVAQAQGRAQLVVRVDGLVGREQVRHQAWLTTNGGAN